MFIDPSDAQPLYVQVYEQCKSNIIEGAFPAGDKLPPIRRLADDLGIARNTVEAAYRQLAQEGFVASKPGSGYIVEALDLDELGTKTTGQSVLAFLDQSGPETLKGSRVAGIEYDFTYGDLEGGTFPAETWRKLTTDALFGTESDEAERYNGNLGDFGLRSCIADHLKISRGVRCDPRQVVIQAGTQSAVQNLLQLFDPRSDKVAMEEPGYDGVRMVFENCGFDVVPCPINGSRGPYIDALKASSARIAFVTPSNQFPTGSIMPMKTRQRLLDWALHNEAYIIEDDYCREFRYNIRATPSLQSLDTYHRVIYMGTFSKALSPALRINYLVLPPKLLERWQQHFGRYNSTVPWLSQAVLRRFIEQGHWDKHLRRAQTRNKRKRETLMRSLKSIMGSRVDIVESGAGLHLLVGIRNDDRPQEELIAQAGAAGVRVYSTDRYWMRKPHPLPNHVLIGFSAIAENDIEPGIHALSDAWFGTSR